jgi:hypothetical protein
MRDYVDGRIWAEHGQLFSKQVAEMIAAAKVAFCRLQHIEFDAPWRQTTPGNC